MLKTSKSGITLIALVITIIVLLILAGISISILTGDNSTLSNATQAKEKTTVGEEKEQVEMAYVSAAIKKLGGNVTNQDLQDELDLSVGLNKTEVTPNGDDTLNVYFTETEHNYNLNKGVVTKVATIIVPQVTDTNPGEFTGSGTEASPYQIASIEDLVGLSQKVEAGDTFSGKYFELTTDLDFKSTKSYVDSTRIDMGDVNRNETIEALITELTTEEGFKPIGYYRQVDGVYIDCWFDGIIDGNNHTIYNLYQNVQKRIDKDQETGNSYGWGTGLIGCSDSNITIKNLNMSKVNITSNYSEEDLQYNFYETGALIGTIGGRGGTATVENCTADGIIKVDGGRTGGLVGSSWTQKLVIRNCKNYCDVYGTGLNGGIIGQAASSIDIIENCENYGNVYGCDMEVGGIVGEYAPAESEENAIKNCFNYGKVYFEIDDFTSDICVGGIAGFACDTESSNCINYGDIIAKNKEKESSEVGGLFGEIHYGKIENSANLCKNVQATNNSENIGGIAGKCYDLEITNCINTATVQGKENIGGIVGTNGYITWRNEPCPGKLKNCYNIGQVTGTSNVGGLVGLNLTNAGSTIENSYYLSGVASIGYTNDTDPVTTSSDGVKTETEMKADAFVTLLNNGGNNWNKDTSNKNQGFPILSFMQ